MEIVKILRRTDITSRESKVIWFLLGELYGNLHDQKIIKTVEFCDGTGLNRDKVTKAIQGLIKKEIIIRQSTEMYGFHRYSFNKQKFGRNYAVENIKPDIRGLKLLQGGKGKKKLSTAEENEYLNNIPERDGLNNNRITNGYDTTSTSDTVPSSKISQSLYRDEISSQRQKELLAHEERKQHYLRRGSGTLAELIANARIRGTA